ncbi:acyl carrier protein [Mycolicibacterium fluoranthenivorans]|uniref:Phosphopantetheine attachment site n=1 Tax=Mycolicibacterium fluoranthenivorans TaxID=258505 RepID=A0A1G4VHW9_9MYCO|nr:acyl carrier protein [Mycolicibacterium fluoranthenivorans]SCX07047.1 Phosphopantetheine attachment site [Mycolicibacterium fluoranthenivorans]
MSVSHIVQIFARVLGVDDIGPRSDFFELGGDSLLATRVLSAIARDFGTELSWDDFTESPTAAGLFAKVAATVR